MLEEVSTQHANYILYIYYILFFQNPEFSAMHFSFPDNCLLYFLSPVHGGRSRLHLIDLASCEGYTGSKKDGGASSMSLSGLGNVIISLINGAKHVPHRCAEPITLKRSDHVILDNLSRCDIFIHFYEVENYISIRRKP